MSYSTKEILKAGGAMIALIFLALVILQAIKPPIVGAVLSIGLVAITLLLFRRYAYFIRGTNAELDVVLLLRDLPEDFSVGYNLVLGQRGNVDIVVAGPTGVWTLEIKSKRGYIHTRTPFLQKHIRQAHAEAYAVRDFLAEKIGKKIIVQPVLVFNNAVVQVGPKPIDGVYIVEDSWLKKLLVNTPTTIDSESLRAVKEILRPLVA